MKGDSKVIEMLNRVLTGELTAINQYFLHARMLQDWGFDYIGKLEYDASIDEMKHADELIKRILFLEGVPNVQKLNPIVIGESVEEILKADLSVEEKAIPVLKEAIVLAEEKRDFVSRDLFCEILESEEEHVDWLETQLGLYQKLGKENYLQSQVRK